LKDPLPLDEGNSKDTLWSDAKRRPSCEETYATSHVAAAQRRSLSFFNDAAEGLENSDCSFNESKRLADEALDVSIKSFFENDEDAHFFCSYVSGSLLRDSAKGKHGSFGNSDCSINESKRLADEAYDNSIRSIFENDEDAYSFSSHEFNKLGNF